VGFRRGVRVSELPLDHDEQDTFMYHLDRVHVSQSTTIWVVPVSRSHSGETVNPSF
jgi:hypothetical protein